MNKALWAMVHLAVVFVLLVFTMSVAMYFLVLCLWQSSLC